MMDSRREAESSLTPGARVTVDAKPTEWSPLPTRIGGVVIEVCERMIVVETDDGIVRSVKRGEVRGG